MEPNKDYSRQILGPSFCRFKIAKNGLNPEVSSFRRLMNIIGNNFRYSWKIGHKGASYFLIGQTGGSIFICNNFDIIP